MNWSLFCVFGHNWKLVWSDPDSHKGTLGMVTCARCGKPGWTAYTSD